MICRGRLMPGLSRAFTVLGKIASSAAMLGFRSSYRLIPLSSGLRLPTDKLDAEFPSSILLRQTKYEGQD